MHRAKTAEGLMRVVKHDVLEEDRSDHPFHWALNLN